MNRVIAFRTLAALNSWALIVFQFTCLTDFAAGFKFNPLRTVFMTQQINLAILMYFTFSVLGSLLNHPKIIEKVRNIAGFIFAAGMFIGIGYYLLVYPTLRATELTQKSKFVTFYSHWSHAVPMLLVAIEVIILSFEGVRLEWKRDFKLLVMYGIFYQAWLILCYQINRKWPYWFQGKMTPYQHFVFNNGCIVVLLMLNLIGYCVNSWILQRAEYKVEQYEKKLVASEKETQNVKKL